MFEVRHGIPADHDLPQIQTQRSTHFAPPVCREGLRKSKLAGWVITLYDLRKRIDRLELKPIFLNMRTLMELQKEITELGEEERSGLASFILSSLPNAPLGPDDEEVAKRENEMDSGEATPISYAEFKQAVGR